MYGLRIKNSTLSGLLLQGLYLLTHRQSYLHTDLNNWRNWLRCPAFTVDAHSTVVAPWPYRHAYDLFDRCASVYALSGLSHLYRALNWCNQHTWDLDRWLLRKGILMEKEDGGYFWDACIAPFHWWFTDHIRQERARQWTRIQKARENGYQSGKDEGFGEGWNAAFDRLETKLKEDSAAREIA